MLYVLSFGGRCPRQFVHSEGDAPVNSFIRRAMPPANMLPPALGLFGFFLV